MEAIKEHIRAVEYKLCDSVHTLNRRDAVLLCIQLRWCLILKKIINAFSSIKILLSILSLIQVLLSQRASKDCLISTWLSLSLRDRKSGRSECLAQK
jgi:hypothetical protein